MVNRHQGDCIPKDLVSTHGDVFLSIHPSLKRAWDFGPWLGPPAEKLSPSTIQQALNCQLMRNKNYGKLALTNQKEATWHVGEAPLVGGPHMDILQGWPPLSSSPYKSINRKRYIIFLHVDKDQYALDLFFFSFLHAVPNE